MSYFSALLASGGFNPVTLNPYLWTPGSGYNSSTGAWTDSSTNARNGSQATSGKRPTTTTDGNGNVLLVSDGTDDYIDSGLTGNTILNGSCSFWIITKPADGQPAGDQTLIGNQHFEITLKTDGSIYVRYNDPTNGAKIAQTIAGVYANGSTVMNLIRVDVNFTLSQIFIYVGNTLCQLDSTNNGDIDAQVAANFSSASNLYYFAKNASGTAGQFYAGNTGEIYIMSSIPTLVQANQLLTYFLAGEFAQLQPPTDPTTLVLTGTNYDAVSIGWTDNATNEESYEVYRSTNGVTYTKIATTLPNVNSYADSGLSATTLYYYKVRAWSQQGHSNYLSGSVTTPALSLNEFHKFVAADVSLVDPLQVRVSGSDNFLIKGIDQGTSLKDIIQNTAGSQGKIETYLSKTAVNCASGKFYTQDINGAANWTNGDFEVWIKCAVPVSSLSHALEGEFITPNGFIIWPSLFTANKIAVRMFGSGGNKAAEELTASWGAGGLPSPVMILRVQFDFNNTLGLGAKKLSLYKANLGDATLPKLSLSATHNGDCSAINYIGMSTASLYHINGYSTAGATTSAGNPYIYDRRVFNRILTNTEALDLFTLLNV